MFQNFNFELYSLLNSKRFLREKSFPSMELERSENAKVKSEHAEDSTTTLAFRNCFLDYRQFALYLLWIRQVSGKMVHVQLPLWLVFAWGAFLKPSNGASFLEQRSLQEEYLYSSNYTADFQYLSDVTCDGDSLTLQLTCLGPSLTVIATSDDSIACRPMSIPRFPNTTTFQCLNGCTDCESVYRLKDNNATIFEGPVGSISFVCAGNSVDDVGAVMEVLGGSTPGYCSASGTPTRGRNIHAGRMGVSCPISTTARQYVYDDTYFDCLSEGTISVDVSAEQESDIFACATGFVCNGEECSYFFDDVLISTTVDNFYDCVESSSGMAITSAPTRSPMLSAFTFLVQFEASWGQLYVPVESASVCSSASEPTDVLLSCDNGAAIEFISSTDTLMTCSKLQENQLSCIANEASLKNRLVSVFYVSATSNEIHMSSASLIFVSRRPVLRGTYDSIITGDLSRVAGAMREQRGKCLHPTCCHPRRRL